jgi:hypothetical protein
MPTGSARLHGRGVIAARDLGARAADHRHAGRSASRLPGRTPLIFIEIPGKGDETVLLYGHLDKQPEMVGWNRSRSVDSGEVRRQALRPRWRRRWLRDLCLADRDHGAEGTRRRSCALRGADRGLRGIRQLRSAGFYMDHLAERIGSPLWWCAWIRARQLRPAVADHLPARPGRRHAERQACSKRACIRATPAAWCRVRASACCASCSIASRIRPPAASRSRLYVDIPGAHGAGKQGRGGARRQRLRQVPVPARHAPMGHDLSELVLNRTWRPTLSVTGADGLPARSPMPATCCARTPR